MADPEARRRAITFRFAVLAAAAYALLWGAFDYLMDRALSLHIWDAGANYVLTNMTSPPGLDYGHLTSAPQNLIYLFFTPLTRAFPDPLTLIFAEDILLGLSGVFVFLVVQELWQRPGRALLVELLYLFNYSLFGAPFYPNHYEILFSVFFPIAYFAHLRHREWLAAGLLVLAALSSSLGAVTAGLFVALLIGPRILGELRGRGIGLLAFLRAEAPMVASFVASLGIFVLPFLFVGTGTTLSYAHLSGSPTSPDLVSGLLSDPTGKLVYVLLLGVPFVPVMFRSRYVLMLAPYLGLVVAGGSDHYAQFGYQYSYIVGAVLFIAWAEALRRRYAVCALAARPLPSAPRASRSRRSWRRVWKEPELIQLTGTAVVLGFFALPYSPGNAWAGNSSVLPFHDYDFRSLITVTPFDQAVWAMAGEIPVNASVLIQEDMAMLTNRAVWYEPGSYSGEPVEYALTNPTTFWFTYTPPGFIGPYPTTMLTWVNDLYQNESFGIVQEYQGAILLQHGYVGLPRSFVPLRTYLPGVAFVTNRSEQASSTPGAETFSNLANASSEFRTEGPMVLPPGAYSLTYYLSVPWANGNDHAQLGLWSNASDPTPVSTVRLSGSDFRSGGTWTAVTWNFTLDGYIEQAYFGAYGAVWSSPLSVASVYLNQTAPA